jgi:hypothetical protein
MNNVFKSMTEAARNIFSADPAPRTPADVEGRYANFNGPFLPPGQPPAAMYPKVTPRSWSYLPGVNLNVLPRAEDPRIPTFEALRAAYQNFSPLRPFTTFRSQQILAMDWQLKEKEGSGFHEPSDKAMADIRSLLETPDPKNNLDFEQWVRMLLEEVYVTDALSIFPVKGRNGKIVAWRIIDGSSIRPLLDYEGNMPTPPDAAFMQFIYGSRFTTLTSDELFYRPFRPRAWTAYGASRVENVLMTAVLYQLHENFAKDYFTVGNIPEAVALQDSKVGAMMPDKFHLEWQNLIDQVAGVNTQRRRIHMMPPQVRDVKTLKEFAWSKELPEFLCRVMMIEFGVPIYLIASQSNRSTAKEMNEALYQAPLRSDTMSLKRVMDKLLIRSGYPETEVVPSPQFQYDEDDVKGVVLAATPFADGTRIMEIREARQKIGLSQDTELAGGEEENPESGEEGEEPGDGEAPPKVAKFPAPAPAEPKEDVIKALGQTKEGKLKRRAFIGEGQKKRVALAKNFEQNVLKKLRRQQAAIEQEAMKKARERGKRVVVG